MPPHLPDEDGAGDFFSCSGSKAGVITFMDPTELFGGTQGWVMSLEKFKRESTWHCAGKLLLTMMCKKSLNFTCSATAFFNFFQWKKPGVLSFCKLFLMTVQVSVNNFSKLKGKKKKKKKPCCSAASRTLTKTEWFCTNTCRHL